MSGKSKLKLLASILILFVVGSGLFVYMDYTSSTVGSTTAVLKANTVTVGTDYAGTVTQQLVQVGDHVDAGQKLFYLKSATLVQALNSNQLQKKDLLFTMTSDGQMIITASNAGYVSNIAYTKGSYIPNSSRIATITTDDTMMVTAKFKMTPTQYAHTTSSTPFKLSLPDGTTATGKINSIAIDSQTNPLLVTVTASAHDVNYGAVKAGQDGVPVNSNLVLKQNTYWSRIANWLH